MSFSYYIAKRYLFSKTSTNAINIITMIASFGVIVGSLALFIILSGFSGLRTFNYSLLAISDPDLKITPTKGKSFLFTEDIKTMLDANPAIGSYSKIIEERVFLKYKDKNEIAYIKGVEASYAKVTNINEAIDAGEWLDFDYVNTAVIGNGISRKLSLGILNFNDPLQIMVPKAGTGFINPQKGFSSIRTEIIGIYSGTEEFTNSFVFVTLEQAAKLLQYKEKHTTAIELRIAKNTNPDEVRDQLQKQLGSTFKVQTKAQLNELLYKVINTENFVSYLIFTLIVIIALFNVIGAIIMMIIDKKENLKTLLSIGATLQDIKKIFVLQGFLLTLLGMSIGLLMGMILVALQKEFGLFMITQNFAYPVEFRMENLLIVIATISILGYIASRIASARITRAFIDQ